MNYKRIAIALTAFAVGASLAACKSTGLPGQAGNGAGGGAGVQESLDPDAKTVIGKVTSFNGTKITIDIGEFTQPSPDETGNGDDKGNDKDKDKGNDKGNEDDGSGQKRRRTSFKSTGESATYDISGLKRITFENGRSSENETLDKIKTGYIVAIVLDKDGNPTSLTIKSGSTRPGGNRPDGTWPDGTWPEGSRPSGRPDGKRPGNDGQDN